MSKSKEKLSKEEKKIKEVAEIANYLADWMWGDHGPLGWNDHAGVQDRLRKMNPQELLLLANLFGARFQQNMVREIAYPS